MAKAFENLLGKQLLDRNAEVSVESVIGEGKVLGLYFSAHWCPPCRGFTPRLAEFYKAKRGDGLEIVFVSSDKSEKEFNEYFKEMPWLALPFGERDRKKKLSQKYKIAGIPTLVLLDGKDASVITKDGRGALMEDQKGERFPWRPKPLHSIISGKLTNKNNSEITVDDLKGKFIGIYFSAHWCPPCRGFTPVLVSTYQAVKKTNHQFEVIFVTSDRNEESFKEYLNEMPWYAIPFNDVERRQEITKHFAVEGIPTFIIVDENWKVIITNGRSAVMHDTQGKDFPWKIKPFNELNARTASIVNEETCAIYFTDGDDDSFKQSWDMLAPLAEGLAKESAEKGEDRPITFLCARNDEVAESLREFAFLPDEDNILIILDVPSRRVYVCDKEEITADNAKEFIYDYLADKLQSRPLP